MIVDHLNNADLYHKLGDRFAAALRFCQRDDLLSLPTGRHEIRGSQIFAMVQDYTTKPHDDARFEAHRKYWDIQCVIRGIEQIGYGELAALAADSDYDHEKDVQWFDGPVDLITLRAGMFAILGPRDAHQPGLIADQPAEVRKVVVKVAVED